MGKPEERREMVADPLRPEGVRKGSRIHALEIVFLSAVGLIVLAAFFEAFTYKLVSSRTPFVIMVPLLLLIGFQAYRLARAGALLEVRYHVGSALRGRYEAFGKLWALGGSIVGLAATIFVLGHYIGIGGFVLYLMRVLAREKLLLSLLVAAGTVAAIYGVFELGFNVRLYRGLVFRWMMGYRDF